MVLLPSEIALAEFTSILARYDAVITAASRPKPEPLASLDSWRRTVLPATIAARSPPHMTKPEIYRLVDCKLKRGKMRPILRLIESNDNEAVISATTAAFSAPDVKVGFQQLCTIKGVGPATASYVLAAHKPTEAPVFSDEAFRWVVHGGAWDTKIKYDAKEYWDYYEKVRAIAQRLVLNTNEDVERVGFVLGKEAALAKPGKTTKRKSAPVGKVALVEENQPKKPRKLPAIRKKPSATKLPGSGIATVARALRPRKK